MADTEIDKLLEDHRKFVRQTTLKEVGKWLREQDHIPLPYKLTAYHLKNEDVEALLRGERPKEVKDVESR